MEEIREEMGKERSTSLADFSLSLLKSFVTNVIFVIL